MKSAIKILVSVFLLVLGASRTRADIYEWAWVNPSDPTQGVTQSSVVCPGGSGVSAVPGAELGYLDLTQAYLIGVDLTNADLTYGTLTNANLTGANLTGAAVAGTQFGGSNLNTVEIGASHSLMLS